MPPKLSVPMYRQYQLVIYCSFPDVVLSNQKTETVNGETIERQTRQAMDNLKAIIESAGIGMDNIVKTTCFISNMDNFSQFNLLYSEYFSSDKYPARSCVEVARLPKDVLIEIEAIAVIK